MSVMRPKKYQLDLAERAYSILQDRMMVYIAMEERTGKTLISILTAEKTRSAVGTVGIITMKKALGSWKDTLSRCSLTKDYIVINYHKAHTLPKCDMLILDEAHNYISGYPKPSVIWKSIKKLSSYIPIIYMSATPHAQSMSLLYHQLQLSSWSPWAGYKNFYVWFRDYGVPATIYVGQRQVNVYNVTVVDKVNKDVEGLFIKRTRKQLGFKYEPIDKVHYVELQQCTERAYVAISKKGLYEFAVGTLVADSVAKKNHALYCLEGGTTIIDGIGHTLANTEKIDYIMKEWGDTADMVIMYNYREELTKLRRYFVKAQLLQATSFAEGVELSHIEHLIIYSQDYRASKHTQRRARQASMNRKTPITVHFILVRAAMSERVYKSVVIKKRNFVDSLYAEEQI